MSESTSSACLVVAATSKEIPGLLEFLRSDNVNNKLQVDVLVTGVGLTAATYSLTKQIQLKRPSFVIQAGIAGCFNKEIALGTVFSIKKDIIADQVVIEKGKIKTLFDLSLANANRLPYKKGWLVNDSRLLNKNGLKSVTAISVNEISSSKQKIQLYREKYDPVLESLEGAALHYVCLSEQIPFLQLRAISNYIGERDKSKWQLKTSIHNLNQELIRLLKNL